MKKFLLILLLVTIAFAGYEVNWLRNGIILSNTDTLTTIIPNIRGSEQLYLYNKVTAISGSIPDLLIKWQYSIDNVKWFEIDSIIDTLGNKYPSIVTASLTVGSWIVDSLPNPNFTYPFRAYSHLRLQTICNTGDSGRYYLKSAIYK